ncbi:MAG: hypothetical protein JJ844_00255 [Prochlorococcus marinus CUG1435]|nr:hypothetical protein [Prochlorococcus marinus CUG1435]
MVINLSKYFKRIKTLDIKNSIFKKFFIKFFIVSLSSINIFVNAEPYQKSDFNRLKPGNLNISVYVFHDRNRNGIYDLGDKSMVGVETELIKPDGMSVIAKSNTNGYSNFKMALGSSNYRHINKDNEKYIFKVLEPPNWRITTGNKTQKIVFLRKIGSPGGVIADEPPNWVGLAPNLTIKGQIKSGGGKLPSDLTIKAISPTKKKKHIKLGKNGEFIFPVYKGKWQLIFKSKSINWVQKKIINVSHAPIELMNIFAGENKLPISGKLKIENFDWIQYSDLEKIPDGHLGLKWNYLLAINNKSARGPGYVNILNSGHGIAYSSSGHPVTIEAFKGKKFDFIGGYFTVSWSKANGEELKVEAYRKGEKVFEDVFHLSHLGPKWLEVDLRSIDKLILSTKHYWQFAAEDLHFRIEDDLK